MHTQGLHFEAYSFFSSVFFLRLSSHSPCGLRAMLQAPWLLRATLSNAGGGIRTRSQNPAIKPVMEARLPMLCVVVDQKY
jgi:hypothetical protein